MSFIDIPVFSTDSGVLDRRPHNPGLEDFRVSSLSSPLVLSCHEAFRHELSKLTADELDRFQLDPATFEEDDSLLVHDTLMPRYNPIIYLPKSLLIHLIRYLTYLQTLSLPAFLSSGSESKFVAGDDVFPCLIALSAGILPACVVAVSATLADFVDNARRFVQLAFQIGVILHPVLTVRHSLAVAHNTNLWHSRKTSLLMVLAHRT
jgi:hypothetical protein